MTSASDLLNSIDTDLNRGVNGVVYLEGKTDVEPFFALLGVEKPSADVHQGVLVRGLENDGKHGRVPGAGSSAVRARVTRAFETGRAKVYGLVDGDGRSADVVATEFGAPQRGPLFAWDGYCIENLLAREGWPAQWGEAPDWVSVLREYTSYVALGRVHVALRTDLTTLRLEKFHNPQVGAPLLASTDVRQALEADKHRIQGVDVAARFAAEAEFFSHELDASLARGHMLLNGKWLLRHYAADRTKKGPDECRTVWCEAVRAAGGSPAVKEWWERLFSS